MTRLTSPLDSTSGEQGERDLIRVAVARLRASIMAVVFGFVCGTALLLATLWLVILGGPEVGPHLGLLNNYFPGYSVTWSGSVIGFIYGAMVGSIFGWAVAWAYNLLADFRQP